LPRKRFKHFIGIFSRLLIVLILGINSKNTVIKIEDLREKFLFFYQLLTGVEKKKRCDEFRVLGRNHYLVFGFSFWYIRNEN